MIQIERISKEFKEGISSKRVKALEELELQVHKGEVFGFLGPNGAGKSTTIKILINLIYPDSGRAFINGKDVRDKETRRHVGYLPENPYFYDYLTAEELLWFGGRASGLPSKAVKERTDELLNKVNLHGARRRQLRTYSKGMVQRAGLALSLVHDPEVVILDEPMSGLDPIGRKMVGDLIVELKEQGKTVFFSSHILTDIERFCDRVGIIVGGRLRLVDRLGKSAVRWGHAGRYILEGSRKGGGRYGGMNLWPVAAVTFKEGIRSRAIYGISIFALLLLGANLLISGMIMREVGKVAVDMALSTVSFTGLLLVLFIGINTLIDEHIYYESLGRTKEERQARYREFVKEGLKEEKLKEIRDSIISGKGYGSEEYLQKVEESIKARLRKGRRGRPKKKDV
jgi:ABC-2 type transport system ATP-binding protein